MENRSERFKLCSGGSGLDKVNARLLSITLGDIVHLVPDDFATIILFLFTDQLSFQKSPTSRNIRTWHQDKNLEIIQAIELLLCTGDPIFLLWGGHGFSPGGIVTGVNSQFKGACFDVREKHIHGAIEVWGKIEWKEIMCVTEFRKL